MKEATTMPEVVIELFRSISLAWSLAHTLILFLFLYEFRYSKKRTLSITLAVLLPILVLNMVILVFMGADWLGKLIVWTTILPSLVLFWILSKYRDGRFFFTFCVVDTVSFALIILTGLADMYIFRGKCIFLLISRLLIYPVLEWLVVKYIRKYYFSVQVKLKRGWTAFAITSALFYLLLLILMNYPASFTEYRYNIPDLIILITLMPMIYYNIFHLLQVQSESQDSMHRKEIFALERAHMEEIIQQNSETEEKLRIERHDLRHRLTSLRTMIENQNYDEAIEYLNKSSAFFSIPRTNRLCQNTTLDAVFSSYFSQAEQYGIEIEHSLAIPSDLSVDPTELSIVIANALENAIHACQELPEERRIIRCKYVVTPRHMLQISNPYTGIILFDEYGRPTSSRAEHGIGTQSIVAFCDKYAANLNYKVADGWFHIRIIM
jgi:sensor histidine kinase YesM